MTTKLEFGVIEMPYTHGEGADTVAVANILEERYHVYQHFFDKHKDDIQKAMCEALSGAIEDLFAGAPVHENPFADSDAKIADMFRMFLMTGEIESMGIEGVPTKAAIKRRSARFKKGKANKPRPSFVDSGLYESAAAVWVQS